MKHEEKFIFNTKEAKALYQILGGMDGTDKERLAKDCGREYEEIFNILFKRFNKL